MTAERYEQATYVTVNMGDQRGIRRWEEGVRQRHPDACSFTFSSFSMSSSP
jgi:hypothetical protein